MKNKENDTVSLFAGDIQKEISEIEKMQSSMPYILSIVTNTCTGVRTIFCC